MKKKIFFFVCFFLIILSCIGCVKKDSINDEIRIGNVEEADQNTEQIIDELGNIADTLDSIEEIVG